MFDLFDGLSAVLYHLAAFVLGALCAQVSFTVAHRAALRAGVVLPTLVPGAARAPAPALSRPRCDACAEALPVLSSVPVLGWLRGCRACGSRGSLAAVITECSGGALCACAIGAPAPVPVLSAVALVCTWSAAVAVERIAVSVPLPLLAALLGVSFASPLVVAPPAALTGAACASLALGAMALVCVWRALPPALLGYEWFAAIAVCAALGPVLGFVACAVALSATRLRLSSPGLLGPLAFSSAVLLGTLWLLPPAQILAFPIAPAFPWFS